MRTIAEIENEIVDDFALFDTWEEKYQYIIEIGQKLKPLAAEFKVDENKIKGCQSSVWLTANENNGIIEFFADSDSVFVKGEIALLMEVLSGQPAEAIVNAELRFIDQIGLRSHMAQTRANGLAAMIKQMKLYAVGFQHKNM
jgi:cysteine desulfuration protein SufE